MAPRDETTQESRTCKKHGDYVATTTIRHYAGEAFPMTTGRCPACEETWQATVRKQEEEQKQAQRQETIARNHKAANIPARFAASTFENYMATSFEQRRALSVAKGFAENFKAVREVGSSLILCGKWGTGKTHLAFAIANHLLESERTIKYVTVAELIREIRATWRRECDQSENSVISKFQKAGLLILDEVGGSFGGEAEEKQLFDVLDGRYRERRPTVIVSNLSGKAFQQCLGPRLFDRLTQNGSAIVVFDWESYRPTAPTNATANQSAVEQIAPFESVSERTRRMRGEA